MKYLFNVLVFALVLQFSSCIKEEIDPILISPGLSDFNIGPKNLGEAPFVLMNPKSKSEGRFLFKTKDTGMVFIEGNTVTLKRSGICTITAVQLASGNYKQDSIQATFNIAPLQWPQLSGFPALEKQLGDAPFEITAPKSSSKGAITYISSNPAVASITGNMIYIKSVGKTDITASQAANGIYKAVTITAELVVIYPPVAGTTLRDVDGNVYATIKIGTQTWMMENLRTTHYKDGTAIPHITDAKEWAATVRGAYCNYDNNTANGVTYGKLYNWEAAHHPDIAPAGWHVPTDAEWQILYNYIGGTRYQGGKIQQPGTSLWSNDTGASNSTLFTALPAGRRNEQGVFSDLKYDGIWWTSTQSGTMAVYYDLYVKGYIERHEADLRSGFSIRCIKD